MKTSLFFLGMGLLIGCLATLVLLPVSDHSRDGVALQSINERLQAMEEALSRLDNSARLEVPVGQKELVLTEETLARITQRIIGYLESRMVTTGTPSAMSEEASAIPEKAEISAQLREQSSLQELTTSREFQSLPEAQRHELLSELANKVNRGQLDINTVLPMP